MDPQGAPKPLLRVLSLDGGGIRGKSSLIILEKIMERIRDSEGLSEVPRPCDYFDLIGGTSTGGIIAIMLGRLRMTVDECIRAYENIGQAAFTPKRTLSSRLPGPPRGAFSATALEDAIKQVVREYCTHPGCVTKRSNGQPTTKTCPHEDLRFRDGTCTKTVVLAITKANVDARPTLFTTYDLSANTQDCSIWQVSRATSAATTFFKSIKLGRDNIEFIDAGFGNNNPCEILIEEARKQYPDRHEFRVLSIGTGLGNIVDVKNSRRSILQALKKMASSSKRVAATLKTRYSDGEQYHRFNVDRGLEDITLSDWEKTSEISAHTHNYMNDNEKEVEEFVKTFLHRTEGRREVEAGNISNISTPNGRFYSIPFLPNRKFTGRKETLHALEQRLFVRQDCQKLAVFGLGGMGKTQVTLQFAYWVKKHQPQYSVFWVPALSEESFTKAYKEVAEQVGIPINTNQEDPRLSLQRHLSSKDAGKWLLIVDNADDGDLLFGETGIHKYLPQSEMGLTIFTTRFKDIGLRLAQTGLIKLQEMQQQEARELLEASLLPEVLRDEATSTKLLAELNYLPLAITQAAAYLNRNESSSVKRYLELLLKTENDAASLLGREFPDNARYPQLTNAVAATWLVSFEQIKNSKAHGPAADLLTFISCIEPKSIPRSIFPRLGSEEETDFAIGTLTAYAFITSRGVDEMYDMHSLVHTATRVWTQQQALMEMVLTKAIRHLGENFPSTKPTNRQGWQTYLPHAFRLLSWSKKGMSMERMNLLSRVGECLYHDRRFKDAVECFEEVAEWKRASLPDEAPSLLASEHWLASTYVDDQKIQDAIKIFKHIVEVQKKTLDEKDATRLASEHGLAGAYILGRQIQDAIVIMEHIIEVQKTLDEEDHVRLTSEQTLASAYVNAQRIQDAIVILEHIVEVRKRILDEEDQYRLASEHTLARAYLDDGRIQDATRILEHVVQVRKKTLDEEDHHRLQSEYELARAYYFNNGQVGKSIRLLEHAVKVRQKISKEEDHERLASEYALARSYLGDNQVDRAIKLFEHVIAVRQEMVADDDRDLRSYRELLQRAYNMLPDTVP